MRHVLRTFSYLCGLAFTVVMRKASKRQPKCHIVKKSTGCSWKSLLQQEVGHSATFSKSSSGQMSRKGHLLNKTTRRKGRAMEVSHLTRITTLSSEHKATAISHQDAIFGTCKIVLVQARTSWWQINRALSEIHLPHIWNDPEKGVNAYGDFCHFNPMRCHWTQRFVHQATLPQTSWASKLRGDACHNQNFLTTKISGKLTIGLSRQVTEDLLTKNNHSKPNGAGSNITHERKSLTSIHDP